MKKYTLSFILKMSLPYIFILIIPFLVLFKVYFSSIEHAFKIEKDKNMLILEQSSEYIDSQIKSFSHLSQYIASNQDIIPLLSLKNSLSNSEDFFYIYEFCTRTPNYKLINPSIEDVYIFLGHLNYIIELPTAYRLSDFLLTTDFSPEDFNRNFLSLFHYNRIFVSPTYDLMQAPDVFFINSLPYNTSDNITSQLVIKLNTQHFFDRLNNIELGTEGAIFVLDSTNTIILSKLGNSSTLSLENLTLNEDDTFSLTDDIAKDFTLFTQTSDYNDWTYATIIPNDLIKSQVSYIRTTILALILLALFITLLVSAFLGLRNSMFFMNIFSYLTPLSNTAQLSMHPYKRIEKGISLLRSQNDQLTSIVHNQAKLLHTSIIKEILYGNYKSPNELQQMITSLDVSLDSACYCTIIFKLVNTPNSTELTSYSLLSKSFLTSLLDEYCDFKHFYLDIDAMHMATLFILPTSNHAPKKLIMDLEEVITLLESSYHLKSLLAISRCCNKLSSVHKYFAEVSRLCEYGSYLDYTGVILPNKMPTDSSILFYYPLTIELDLVKALHFENPTKLKTLLDDIYRVNFTERTLCLDMIKQFTTAVSHTLIHILSGIIENTDSTILQQVKYLRAKLECTLSISELYAYTLETHQLICGECKLKRDTHNEQTIKQLKEMIANSYQDSNFNICILAEKCQINENTLYKNFKDWFGMTFSDYLENYRIEVACKLLSQKDVPIKDITFLVGYNSDYSFRRAFKRCMGVPPSKYTSGSK